MLVELYSRARAAIDSVQCLLAPCRAYICCTVLVPCCAVLGWLCVCVCVCVCYHRRQVHTADRHFTTVTRLWYTVDTFDTVEVGFLYSAAYAMTGPARFTISEVAVDWQELMVLQRKLRPSNCTR